MRPVAKGPTPSEASGAAVTFAHYRDARDPLIARIGDYCSYCEVALHGTIHVEHVRPKTHNPGLERAWDNFLLACDNCNSVKGDENIDVEMYLWPDKDNTARPFIYEVDRAPIVGGALTADERTLAEATLQLTGLDREPLHPELSARDRRWLKRREVWGVALIEYRKIQRRNTEEQRDSTLQVAIARGFWSVWMTVFADDEDMRNRLRQWFPGTAPDCFGQQMQFLRRVGGKL